MCVDIPLYSCKILYVHPGPCVHYLIQIEECRVCSEFDAEVLFKPCLHMVACLSEYCIIITCVCGLILF